MPDVERSAVRRENAKRDERPPAKQIEKVLRAHFARTLPFLLRHSNTAQPDCTASFGSRHSVCSEPSKRCRQAFLELLDFVLKLFQSLQERRQVGFFSRLSSIELQLHTAYFDP